MAKGRESDSADSEGSGDVWKVSSGENEASESAGSARSDGKESSAGEAEEPDDLGVAEAPLDRVRAGAPITCQQCKGAFVVGCQECLRACLAMQHRLRRASAGEPRVYAMHAEASRAGAPCHKAFVLE